jgi:transposase
LNRLPFFIDEFLQPRCSGLIEPDTLIRDYIYQLLRCLNGTKRTNKPYSKEYKEEAVALIRDQGYTVPEAAKSLGIASNILYRWKDKIASDREGKSLSTDEREELIRLRKENKNWRLEKAILKKASVGMPHHLFAKEMK